MIILFIVSTILAPSNAVAGLDNEFRVVLPVECPCGLVSMWFGPMTNIPNGYQLCNGENGTPDLQGRFPLGINVKDGGEPDSPGDQGGNANCEVTITEANLPRHVHDITAVDTDVGCGGHNHDITGPTSKDGLHAHTFSLSADTSGSHNHGLDKGGNCNYNYGFVMDESGSVGENNYQKSIDFIIDLIRNNIADAAQLMALAFNFGQDWIYRFSQTQLPREKLQSNATDLIIDELTKEKSDYNGGSTGTASAMEAAISEFETNNFTQNNILLLVTDGKPNSSPCTTSILDGINNNNIRVIIVGVGSFNPNAIACLASDPADIIDIDNFNFDPVVTQLQQQQVICDNGAGTDMEPHHMHGAGTLSADDGGEHKHDLESFIDNDNTNDKVSGMVWDTIVDGLQRRTFQTLNMDGTHGHTISGDTAPDGNHDHGLIGNTDYDGDHEHTVIGTIDNSVDHSHTVNLTTDSGTPGDHDHTVTGQTDATGGDVALNIKPPYTAVYFICCVGDVQT